MSPTQYIQLKERYTNDESMDSRIDQRIDGYSIQGPHAPFYTSPQAGKQLVMHVLLARSFVTTISLARSFGTTVLLARSFVTTVSLASSCVSTNLQASESSLASS